MKIFIHLFRFDYITNNHHCKYILFKFYKKNHQAGKILSKMLHFAGF